MLIKILNCLSIEERDKILDYGSGKGFAMTVFAMYPFSEVHGVELISELHNISMKNFYILHLNHLVSFNVDATLYEDIDKYTYFFFFNPFKGKVLMAVINRIKESYIRSPRKITIIYQNPQERKLFLDSGIFPYHKKVAPFKPFDEKEYKYNGYFLDIFCTEMLNINFIKFNISTI